MSELIKIKFEKGSTFWRTTKGRNIVCTSINKWFLLPETDTLWLEISDKPMRHAYRLKRRFLPLGASSHYCLVDGRLVEITRELYLLLKDTSYLRVLYE